MSSVKTVVQAIARQALAQLVGIQEQVTYKTILQSEYNTETGEVTKHEDAQRLLCVFGNYTRHEILMSQGDIEKNDRKALIVPADFRGIKPTFNDTITRKNGEVWKIMEGGIGLDPAEALYVLQVRKIG